MTDALSLCWQLAQDWIVDEENDIFFQKRNDQEFIVFYRSISLMPHLFDKCVYCWNWNQQVACCFKLPSPFLLPSVTVAAVFNTRYCFWSCRLWNLLEKKERKTSLKVRKMCQFNRSLYHIDMRDVTKNNSSSITTSTVRALSRGGESNWKRRVLTRWNIRRTVDLFLFEIPFVSSVHYEVLLSDD